MEYDPPPAKLNGLHLGFIRLTHIDVNELSYFNDIWSANILKHVVRESNRYILEISDGKNRTQGGMC